MWRRKRVVFKRYILLRQEEGEWIAEFRGSERAKPSARVCVDREIFEDFLSYFNLEKVTLEDFRGEKKGVSAVYATENDYVFELLMIYAFVLRVLRREDRKKLKRKLTETLLRIHPHELIFWNHHFTRSRDRYAQDRVARAFLTLYNLVEHEMQVLQTQP